MTVKNILFNPSETIYFFIIITKCPDIADTVLLFNKIMSVKISTKQKI